MPYIAQEARTELHAGDAPITAGELNYLITQLIDDFLNNIPYAGYAACNDVIGALEACKLEFYRRFVAPYEDKKIESNGDVKPYRGVV